MKPFTKHIKMHELRVQALSRGLGARLNVNQGASDSCSPPPFFSSITLVGVTVRKVPIYAKHEIIWLPDKSIYRIWYLRDRKGLWAPCFSKQINGISNWRFLYFQQHFKKATFLFVSSNINYYEIIFNVAAIDACHPRFFFSVAIRYAKCMQFPLCFSFHWWCIIYIL